MTEDQLPIQWRKGMERAIARHLKATLTARGTYRVQSGSQTGLTYELPLVAGKIAPCTCKAIERYGTDYVCAHRGAAAIAHFVLHSITIEPAPSVMSMEEWAAAHIHGPIFRPEPEMQYQGVRA